VHRLRRGDRAARRSLVDRAAAPAAGGGVKTARIHRYKGPLVVEEVPQPVPARGDLLVKVHAASVNPVDFKIRDGRIKVLIPYRMPLTMGSGLSGTVVSGDTSGRFKPGDEVFARLDKDRIGTWAGYALVRESAAALKPSRLTHVEAASIPLVGLTSWQAMVEIGKVRPGSRVLIHAGSGGVGTFAIQLAKHLGAWVATTAGARNLELVRSLGADLAIDYRAQEFETAVSDLDFVFDTQGGETLLRSFSVAKPGGVIVGINSPPTTKFAREWG